MKEASEFLDGAFLRRTVLPGVVAASYAHPYIKNWLFPVTHNLYEVEQGVLLLVEIVIFGLIISSAVLPIFYVYEGFRWAWLTGWAKQRNSDKLVSTLEEIRNVYNGRKFNQLNRSEKNEVRRLWAILCDFPVVRSGGKTRFLLERPTRLGNIMAGYELYPESRYGISGIDYWHHLLILAPESARTAFEEKSALAESLVLTSATGVFVALAASCSLVGRLIACMSGHVLINLSLPPIFDVLGLLGGLCAWLLFYQLALPAHRQVRSIFRSLTDLTIPRLNRFIKGFEAPSPLSEQASKTSKYLSVLGARQAPE